MAFTMRQNSQSPLNNMRITLQKLENTHAGYIIGAAVGFGDFILETAHCLMDLILHPIASAREMIHAFLRLDQTLLSVYTWAKKTIADYPSLSPFERGRLLAKLTLEGMSFVVPVSLPLAKLPYVGMVFTSMDATLMRVQHVANKTFESAFTLVPPRLYQAVPVSMQRLQPVGLVEWFAGEGQPTSR